MTHLQRWCALGIVALAFLARVWALDFKPAHFDEGVNGAFIDSMRTGGAYQYDPGNYHGPLHFYVLFTGQQLFGRSLWVLRMPTVLAGTALVLVMLAFRRFLPFRTVALGALFVAISPAMIFYSRYAIHEMWLPLFAAIACYGGFGLAGGKRRPRDLWCVGLGLSGMVLTKETYLLHFIAALLALAAVRLFRAAKSEPAAAPRRRRPADLFTGGTDEPAAVSEPTERVITGSDVAKVWAVCLGLLVAFYSGFGAHWEGVRGMLETFALMQAKGTHAEDGHNKEVLFWAKLLAYYEWPALAGLLAAIFVGVSRSMVTGLVLFLLGAAMVITDLVQLSGLPIPARPLDYLRPNIPLSTSGELGVLLIAMGAGFAFAVPARDPRIRWLALYALGSATAYALIPYKTAWCSVNFLWPLCLVAGYALDRLWAPGLRAMVVVVAALLCAGSVQDSHRLNFVNPTNDSLPPTDPDTMPDGARYAYVQTTFDINRLLIPVRTLVSRDPLQRMMRGVMLGESFPLIWELNDFPNVSFHDPAEPLVSYDADFLIVPEERREEIESQLVGIYFREFYLPRGGGEPSWLYLQAETFRPVVAPERVPELKPRVPMFR